MLQQLCILINFELMLITFQVGFEVCCIIKLIVISADFYCMPVSAAVTQSLITNLA